MPNVYAQMTKITNASGRSDYISSPARQETILLHEKEMKYTWNFYHEYEKAKSQSGQKNNEAREIIIALPNQVASWEKKQMKELCDTLTKQLLKNYHDYEYAVHWNKNKTNLHMHLLFSERLPGTPTYKTYQRDIWQTSDGKMAKANSKGAVKTHSKGDLIYNKDGTPRLNEDVLTAKMTRFKAISFVQEKNNIIKDVFNQYHFKIDVQTKDSPYLSQRKLYKGASSDYIEMARTYNRYVKGYNEAVKQHIKLSPGQRKTYCDIRKTIEREIKQENRKEKKISTGAINCIKEIMQFVRQQVMKLQAKLKKVSVNNNVSEWWETNKERLTKILRNLRVDEKEEKQLQAKVTIAEQYISNKKELLENMRDKDHLGLINILPPKGDKAKKEEKIDLKQKEKGVEFLLKQAEQAIQTTRKIAKEHDELEIDR